MNISQISKKYFQKIDSLDLELIIASAIKKPREFVLAHPEKAVNRNQETKIRSLIERRINHEPLAYILGNKEFYGLNFKVTPDTLIPRPETELLVELALCNIKQEIRDKKQEVAIVDIGTGSGNIIISLAKELEKERMLHVPCCMLYGTDISKKALVVAKHNAKKNKVDKKIKFLKSDLLDFFLKNNRTIKQFNNLIILANLPYLSKEIYAKTSRDVKYEPKSALYSKNHGLYHYEKLLKQIKLLTDHCSLLTAHCLLEISPEQKNNLNKIIKKYFPKTKATFHKDLAGKWRICHIHLN